MVSIRQDIFSYLEAVFTKTRTVDYKLAEVYAKFPQYKPNSVRTYAGQWKEEKLAKLNLTSNSPAKTNQVISQNYSLDEDGYKKYLSDCLSICDHSPALLREFREYIDKTNQLSQKDELGNIDEKQILNEFQEFKKKWISNKPADSSSVSQ